VLVGKEWDGYLGASRRPVVQYMLCVYGTVGVLDERYESRTGTSKDRGWDQGNKTKI